MTNIPSYEHVVSLNHFWTVCLKSQNLGNSNPTDVKRFQ